MSWIEIIADRKIRDAQDEGAFDNLPGKGQPLNLDFDPRVPPELQAAYRMMKDAQILPDWIQLDKEIRQKQTQWDARVEAYAVRRAEDSAHRPAHGGPGFDADLDRARERFLYRSAEGLCELNRMIDRFNLMVPVVSRQRLRIDVVELLRVLEERFPRFSHRPVHAAESWRSALPSEQKPTKLGNRLPIKRKRDAIG
jgi:hypothetical protein